jgi:hypothetical protein
MHCCFGVPEVQVAAGGVPLDPVVVVGPGAGDSGGSESDLGVPGPPVQAANVSANVDDAPIAARMRRSSVRDHFP